MRENPHAEEEGEVGPDTTAAARQRLWQDRNEAERRSFCERVLAKYESVMYAARKTGILPAESELTVTDEERDLFRSETGLLMPKKE